MKRQLSLLILLTVGMSFSHGTEPLVAGEGETIPSDPAQESTGGDEDSNGLVDARVAAVHEASMKARMARLQRAVNVDKLWPPQRGWGDALWVLSLLHINERVPDANQRIRDIAAEDPILFRGFRMTDWSRILALFNSHSPHFPGRLEPETEAILKEVLWSEAKNWVEGWESFRAESDEPEGSIWTVYASENHDLNRKGGAYITLVALAEDPAYRDLKCKNGRTVAEYAEQYTTYFKKWLKERAAAGMWMELDSGYAKYSQAVILNLYDLSPDPEVRQLARMFMDISMIDSEQCSFGSGMRGGGKVRWPSAPEEKGSAMQKHYKLFFGEPGGGASHSRVYETSRHQVPEAAVYLREFGDKEPPFVIRNRMVAESVKSHVYRENPNELGGPTMYLASDSAFFNYVYKTPLYILGSRLSLIDEDNDGVGDDSVNTRQDYSGGLLFNDEKHTRIYPVPEKAGGRAFYPFWQVQHENLMITQRSERGKLRVMVYFSPDLKREEENGWVFASNGKAWAAVKIVGGHTWGEADVKRWPGTTFMLPNDELYPPIIFLTGSEYEGFSTFEEFKNYVLNEVAVEEQPNQIVIERPDKPKVTFHRDYRAPLIEDNDPTSPYHVTPIMRTPYTYDSPYLKTGSNRYEVWVRWEDKRWLYDFNTAQIHKVDANDPRQPF